MFFNLNCSFTGLAESCVSRYYQEKSFVCVCNATYCDTLPQLESLTDGHYQMYTSNKDQLRFQKTIGSFEENSVSNVYTVTVDRSQTHQTVQGFGGSFTDSAGINIASLPVEAQEKLLEAYFSEDGAEYSLCRVPIGGTDFSLYGYSLADDETEGSLNGFGLHQEDYDYKVGKNRVPVSRNGQTLSIYLF